MEITEGCLRPAKDLDNYAKPIIDAVTQSRLLWNDDTQIDESAIRRRRDGNAAESSVEVTLRRMGGQHGGVPSHFRARCAEASQGVITYSHVGYYLATKLMSEAPDDLEEDDWLTVIAHLIDMLDAGQEHNVWIWFHEGGRQRTV
jgi:Endodeoxyribonuclease RusA